MLIGQHWWADAAPLKKRFLISKQGFARTHQVWASGSRSVQSSIKRLAPCSSDAPPRIAISHDYECPDAVFTSLDRCNDQLEK